MLNHNSKYLQWSPLGSTEVGVNVLRAKGKFFNGLFCSLLQFLGNGQPIRGTEHIGIVVLKVGDVCNKT